MGSFAQGSGAGFQEAPFRFFSSHPFWKEAECRYKNIANNNKNTIAFNNHNDPFILSILLSE